MSNAAAFMYRHRYLHAPTFPCDGPDEFDLDVDLFGSLGYDEGQLARLASRYSPEQFEDLTFLPSEAAIWTEELSAPERAWGKVRRGAEVVAMGPHGHGGVRGAARGVAEVGRRAASVPRAISRAVRGEDRRHPSEIGPFLKRLGAPDSVRARVDRILGAFVSPSPARKREAGAMAFDMLDEIVSGGLIDSTRWGGAVVQVLWPITAF